jgi:hypothetical protein
MRRSPPKIHPAPLRSELWRHLEEIRASRRKKKTWQAIAKELQQTGGIKLTAGSVRNFFKRASRRVPFERNVRLEATAVCVETPFIRPEIPSVRLDDDPFSTKVIPFDPWKPQTKARAS